MPKHFFTHAASLDQGFPHCPIFPTAASRRSLGRVSVPMWPVTLSGRLLIVGLVGRCFARLACVKHAASVHPEPGSNSQIKWCSEFSHSKPLKHGLFIRIFRVLHTVQSSVFKVLCVVISLNSNSFSISCCFCLVNTFFIFFFTVFRQLVYSNISFHLCQLLFSLSKRKKIIIWK
ncbi:MAG: hypothetical protein PWP53_2724 [Lacrimispora sp.]|nr:hypothetical protein [Lacrimispora sp.]